MPGSIPATSQLDWLISTTAIIVLSWSRATRDLLKSFGWGIGALHRFTQRRWSHLLAACPIASPGPTVGKAAVCWRVKQFPRFLDKRRGAVPRGTIISEDQGR